MPVIIDAQKKGFPDFELIVCDEAHRTTGVTLAGEDESSFLKVHSNDNVRARKRLYMTATPRIFSSSLSKKAEDAGALLASMDDEEQFGPEFYRLSFSQAVRLNLLSDYKVMIFMVDSSYISDAVVSNMSDGEVSLDDAAKIIGCWKGLSKELTQIDRDEVVFDPNPMRSAVAFSSSIKNSKLFRDNFSRIIGEFCTSTKDDQGEKPKELLDCEVRHVDGKDSVFLRNTQVAWLKEASSPDNEITSCRILSNARCLSEGVDIPALDAIMFLNPRKSEIDIVQSVGRVMRKAPGKKFGYVILPVVIPGDVSPDEALDQNENYRVVWQVLQALRAHDDEFNAIVNSLDLNKKSDKISVNVIGKPEVVRGGEGETLKIPFPPESWRDAIYVRIVQKCGDREYWSKWAQDMAKIAQAHTTRLRSLLRSGRKEVKEAF